MTVILGIDPGVNTGVASFRDGHLVSLETTSPVKLDGLLRRYEPARVVFEDSRLTSPVFSATGGRATALKIARNVGEIDAWCRLICALCEEQGIAAHGISPARKGTKLNAAAFAQITGWTRRSNQHERDAAMCAWPFRRAFHV